MMKKRLKYTRAVSISDYILLRISTNLMYIFLVNWIAGTICTNLNLLLLPLNYHFGHLVNLTVSLDVVTGAVETYGVFSIFVLILAFVTYYRNSFLNIFSTKGKNFINRAKIQLLAKSAYKSLTAQTTLLKKFFKNLLK